MSDFLGKVLAFAVEAHKGQVRKYNLLPYVVHPIRVGSRISRLPYATEEMIAAAFLHDTVEDCGVTISDIETKFGMVVAALVEEMSNTTHGLDIPRAERKRLDRERIAKISKEAKAIKLVDRTDNLNEMDVVKASDFARKYLEESKLLLSIIQGVDPTLVAEYVAALEHLESQISK